jgi:FtsP/CotA-like multicopper oxidase with cupredoxin domain
MNRSRQGALALALALPLLTGCGGDDEPVNAPPETPASVPVTTTTAAPAGTTDETIAETTTAPEPAMPTIAVAGGEPTDGVTAIEVRKGDRIRFAVESDTAAEVHFHGYDVVAAAGPGAPAEFDVEATIEGVFEVELEESGTLIARVSVAP